MSRNLKVVFLDAGHGGEIKGEYQTAGKRSPLWADGSQYFEGVGNREFVNDIANELKERNPFLIVIKVSDSQEDTKLTDRVKTVNYYAKKHGAKNCLLMSVHSNGFSKESAKGWSVFTSKGETLSDEYSDAFEDEMEVLFPNERFRGKKEENFYMLRKTICPAILTENFFHTNEHECKNILMNKAARKKIVEAHVQAVLKFTECN